MNKNLMARKHLKKNIWYCLTHSFFFLIVITLEVNINIFAQDSTETKPTDTTRVEESQLDTVKSNKKAITVVELPNPSLDPSSLDFKIFTSINYNRNTFKNDFFPVFDNSMEFMAVYMPVSMFSYGRIYDKTYEENTGYLLAASIVTNTAVTFATKLLVKRKRVRVYNVYYGVYPKTYAVVDPYSFPSGHTSTVFSLATIFALRYPKYPHVYIPIYTWAVIIGYGRIYLGMHYPSDVLVGALIGTGSSILIHSLRKEFFKFKNNVLGENKNDEGSINAGVLTIFTAGFLTDILLNQFIFKSDSKVTMNTSPFINNSPGFGLNINYKF